MGDADAFDVITAVHDEPIPREARPTHAIAALDRLIAGEGKRASTASFDVDTAVKDLPIPREALPTSAIETLDRVPLGTRSEPTIEAPPLPAPPDHRDAIAEQRGLEPIARPYVRTEGVSRAWFYAAICVSLLCLLAAASAIVWAGEEVQHAEARGRAHAGATLQAAPAPVQRAAVVEARDVAPAPQVAASCMLRVGANVRGASVSIDGVPQGTAPASVSIECKRETTVEVRSARYADFKRAVSTDGALEIHARLEREKTELTVTSEPAGATVTLNGRVVGKTPLVTTVNRHERATLRLRARGVESASRKIMIDEPAQTVNVTLRPRG